MAFVRIILIFFNSDKIYCIREIQENLKQKLLSELLYYPECKIISILG